MVLVDTSVWIRSLANREPYASELRRLLSVNRVVGHPLVYGELLIGDNGGRQRLLADYKLMRQAISVPHDEVVAFAMASRLPGLGLSWIDAHLAASALVGRFRLWTADASLAALALRVGIAF